MSVAAPSGWTTPPPAGRADRRARQHDGLPLRFAGGVVGITHPGSTTERFDYDADGNLTTHVDAKGQRTRYRYDMQSQLAECIDAREQTLGYRYDKALRLMGLVNSSLVIDYRQ